MQPSTVTTTVQDSEPSPSPQTVTVASVPTAAVPVAADTASVAAWVAGEATVGVAAELAGEPADAAGSTGEEAPEAATALVVTVVTSPLGIVIVWVSAAALVAGWAAVGTVAVPAGDEASGADDAPSATEGPAGASVVTVVTWPSERVCVRVWATLVAGGATVGSPADVPEAPPEVAASEVVSAVASKEELVVLAELAGTSVVTVVT